MDRKEKIVLEKIFDYCETIINRIKRFDSLEAFQRDDDRVKATAFDLTQIGELAKFGLSDELKNSISSIPWSAIYGLRNRIVHGYEGITLTIVWQTITEDIPALRNELMKIIKR